MDRPTWLVGVYKFRAYSKSWNQLHESRRTYQWLGGFTSIHQLVAGPAGAKTTLQTTTKIWGNGPTTSRSFVPLMRLKDSWCKSTHSWPKNGDCFFRIWHMLNDESLTHLRLAAEAKTYFILDDNFHLIWNKHGPKWGLNDVHDHGLQQLSFWSFHHRGNRPQRTTRYVSKRTGYAFEQKSQAKDFKSWWDLMSWRYCQFL